MKLNVYIVEDDINACERFKETAKDMNDIHILGSTGDGDVALDAIRKYKPDAVILDLELNKGTQNGLSLLNKLNSFPDSIKPYIVITTNTSNSITYDFIHQNGAGFVFSKYKQDYSEWEVLNLLSLLKNSIFNVRNNFKTSSFSMSEEMNNIIMSDIFDELNKIGIKSSVNGYQYLATAIYNSIVSPDVSMLDELSIIYQKKSSSIEHCMRNAINYAWKKTHPDILEQHYAGCFNSKSGIPTLTMFVGYYSTKLKYKHRNILSDITE